MDSSLQAACRHGVNLVPTQVEEPVLEPAEPFGRCRIGLTRAGRSEEMFVCAEARPEGGATDAGAALALAVK